MRNISPPGAAEGEVKGVVVNNDGETDPEDGQTEKEGEQSKGQKETMVLPKRMSMTRDIAVDDLPDYDDTEDESKSIT